jgi:hypothetical protein
MSLPTLTDPLTKQTSVTYTLLMLSTLVLLGAFALKYFKNVDEVSYCLQWFYANAALYLGRRWNASTQTIDNDPNPPQPPSAVAA